MDQNFTEPAEDSPDFSALDRLPDDQLLPQLVAHLREHRTKLALRN